jgi:AraC family transcriptional regulator of arabinose operon
MRDPAVVRSHETPSPAVRILLTGHERREASWCWRPRGTPTALLVHTRAGRGVLRAGSGDDEQVVAAGDTVLWAPGVTHDFGTRPGTEPWEIVWAHFRPREHWADSLAWPTVGGGVGRVPAPSQLLRTRVDEALLEMDSQASSALPRATDLAMNALERALLWLDAASPGEQLLDDRVREAVLFVTSHLDEPLDVTAIADAVHLSASRLTHLFTEQLGTSPARFVEQRRMERAQALLESSSMPVGAVARASGFSSQYYFASRFREFAGMTPSEWRQRARR